MSAHSTTGLSGAARNKWIVALSVTFGTLMGTMDATMVNIALSHIRGSLSATIQEVAWAVTAFTTTSLCVMPLTGFLARRYGQKRVYMAALVLFLVSSLLCGAAQSVIGLVLFRALQGVGAGALLPTEQAILRRTFPSSEQGMAMAVFSLTVMLGPALGPTLGGFIVDEASWPWIFYVNLPIGLLGLAMVARFVEEPPHLKAASAPGDRVPSADWVGIALLLASLMGLQIVFAEGDHGEMETATVVACVAAVIMGLAAFAYRELTARHPAVKVALLAETSFMRATVLACVLNGMLLAIVFLVPLFMQESLGFTAMQAGIALLLRVAVSAAATPVLGRFYARLPPRAVLFAGNLTFAISCYAMSRFTLDATAAEIATTVAIQGIGFSSVHVTLTTLALGRIADDQMIDATGLHAMMRQIGGSIGIALFAALLTHQAAVARAGLVPHLIPGGTELMAQLRTTETVLVSRGLEPAWAKDGALAVLDGTVDRQATLLAFNKLFLLAGGVFLATAPCAWLLNDRRRVA